MKSKKRKIKGLVSAALLEERPPFFEDGPCDKMAELGIKYECAVAKWLKGRYGKRVIHGPWFSGEDKNGFFYCSPDIIILPKNTLPLILCEVKLTTTKAAEEELKTLYIPVIKWVWPGVEILPIVISRNINQKWSGYITSSLEEAKPFSTLIWRR